MKLSRRQVLHLAAGSALLPASVRTAIAQNYPARPIRLVIPFPPGGAFDSLGRPWAERIKPLLGTIVIENIGGAGASLGASTVAHAKPDGYTILLGGTLPHVNEAVLKKQPLYDPVKDLDPIVVVANNCLSIAVIVFLRFHVGAHILRRHQPDVVSERGKLTSEVMSAAARLHGDDAARLLFDECSKGRTAYPTTQHNRSFTVEADQAAERLSKIDSEYGDVHFPSSF